MSHTPSASVIGEENNAQETKTVYKAPTPPTVEPSMSEWSSLLFEIPEENYKKLLAAEGLYDPGSDHICAHYIAMSASSVLEHPYYSYQRAQDPGIAEALNVTPVQAGISDGGKSVYLETCKELTITPIRLFYENLQSSCIDLQYYNFYPVNMIAMCNALERNYTVKSFNVKDTWLNRDACYHLGMMLQTNITLTELNLSGCRIGPIGAVHLCNGLTKNKTILSLNIERNKLTEEGGEVLGEYIGEFSLTKLNLSNNLLKTKSAEAIAEALSNFHIDIAELDLSWNGPFEEHAIATLIGRFGHTDHMEELNLSWTSIGGQAVAKALSFLMHSASLRVLNLSHNSITEDDCTILSEGIKASPNLVVFDISDNVMSTKGPLTLVKLLLRRTVKLQELRMDNITVDQAFITTLKRVKRMPIRQNTIVTYGYIEGNYEKPQLPDLREIVLKRIEYLLKKKKKKNMPPMNVASLFLELFYYFPEPMQFKSYGGILRKMHVQLDDDMLEALADCFPGPRIQKVKSIEPSLMKEYLSRMYPGVHWEPEPEPEAEPEPEPPPKGKKGKEGTADDKSKKKK